MVATGEPPGGGGTGSSGAGDACRVCDWARGLLAAARDAVAPPPVPPPLVPPLPGAPTPPPADAAAAASVPGEPSTQRRADCLGCRLTGLMAGLGGAGYLSSRLLEEPPPRGAHRATLLASSAVLAALGLARGFGWY